MKNLLSLFVVVAFGASLFIPLSAEAGPRRPANPRGVADPRGAADPRGRADPRGYNQSRNDALENAPGAAGARADRAESGYDARVDRAQGAADQLEDASGALGARADRRENRRKQYQ